MPSKEIALITYKESPELSKSDALLVEPLKNEGFTSQAVPWDSGDIDWERFTALVLRSCWNYHYNYQDFLTWLSKIENTHIPLWNPAEVVRWNANKKYLTDLESKGVSTVPTVWLEKDERTNLEDIAGEKKWNDLVVKPSVGASAYGIFRVRSGEYNAAQIKINDILQQSEVMIQPLMEEVMSEGEYSLVFIGGEYSHAMLKTPKEGDFRSNHHCGATEVKVEPDRPLIDQAYSILDKVDSPLLYARIDGINRDGEFVLMELELIEPHLFFDQDQQSPTRFAKALANLQLT
ncbi:hypothetical protein HY468_06060 [Candidatus Roizmanbacteria bacterium]|nr:hypothetical protein [Candidatus Roizmanbacteria bacterium]